MKRVFIDGQEGTTGLQIHAKLAGRSDIDLLEIDAEVRKDPVAKRALMAAADLVVLCLPDAAAIEAVSFAGPRTKVLDASTAHRTAAEWIYGMPELARGQREAIRDATRVSNPGCYPTGFLLGVRPLIDAAVVPKNYPFTVGAVSGYSGGGKKLIRAFEEHEHVGSSPDWTARPYAFSLTHKHVPEMQKYALLEHAPVFCPIVGNYYQGMIVSVPLHVRLLSRRAAPADVHALLSERYASERYVEVMPLGGGTALENGYLSPVACNGTNRIELFVSGNSEQVLVTARLDNLGKGASSAAVQNLNLMLGFEESAGIDE